MSPIRILLAGTLTLLLAACGASAPYGQEPERLPPELSGSDQELMAAYTLSVEDLDHQLDESLEQASESATQPDCEQVCRLSHRICDLSDRICEIAERHPESARPQTQCADSRQRCTDADEDTGAVCDCNAFDFETTVHG